MSSAAPPPVPAPPARRRDLLRVVGPGIVVAATGVGAGDLIAAAKAGATYGLPVLWAALAGALLKYVLTEGIARYQLATGESVLAGWARSFGRPLQIYLLAYFAVWGFLVAAALMSACGLAAHALAPWLPVPAWAVIHSIGAFLLVTVEGYPAFERVMKWATGAMVLGLIGTAALLAPPPGALLAACVPVVPPGGTLLVAGVIGGVGGTVTLLSYGFWMREKRWRGASWLPAVRVDLSIAYGLTGLFGAALVVLGAVVLHPSGLTVEGSGAAVQMATMLGKRLGRSGELLFLIGFWAAVATSIVGVWQGVPYLFAEFAALLRGRPPGEVSTHGAAYRGALVYLTFPPMILLLLGRPVWLVVAYAALGSLFMPLLAGTLLWLNRRGAHGLANRAVTIAALLLCLALFAWLAVVEFGQARF